ncbi:MAG: phosphohistidine phosphatase SixA [Betaproteobacteria bacterium]|nr:phosphohistidine phosphatase SixA [Betaproteobacteria bacterium]
MDLILWRHADARDGDPDLERPLTDKGLRQAEQMAAWLNRQLPEDALILTSPALRTRQTADALQRKYKIVPDLAPGGDVAHVLAASGWPRHKGSVLVVGHQPTLGETFSFLLWGEARPMSIKKGAVVWLTNRVRAEKALVLLKVALTPEML